MVLRKRRAERGDNVADPGLMAGDGIGIPLDHHCLRRGDDMLLRPVERIEVPFLVKDARLGGVEVLRLAVAHDASAERDARTPLIENGEHHALIEPVGKVAAVAPDGDVRVYHLLGGETLRRQMRDERSPARRVPETVLAAHIGTHRARGEIGARAIVTTAHELQVVEVRSLLAHVDDARALGAATGSGVRILDLDTGSVCEIPDRFWKREVLALHDIAEAVAAFAATETMPNLGCGDHMKRRRLLAVEGAASPQILAARFQRNGLLHERHEVGCRAYAILILLRDHRERPRFRRTHPSRYRYYRAPSGQVRRPTRTSQGREADARTQARCHGRTHRRKSR